jgi:hypothetical protein
MPFKGWMEFKEERIEVLKNWRITSLVTIGKLGIKNTFE